MFVESASVTKEITNVSEKGKRMDLTNRKQHHFFSGMGLGAELFGGLS